jgi:hypothetical protein
MFKKIVRSKLFIGTTLIVSASLGINYYGFPQPKPEPLQKLTQIPKREEHIEKLKNEEFDILIIGKIVSHLNNQRRRYSSLKSIFQRKCWSRFQIFFNNFSGACLDAVTR